MQPDILPVRRDRARGQPEPVQPAVQVLAGRLLAGLCVTALVACGDRLAHARQGSFLRLEPAPGLLLRGPVRRGYVRLPVPERAGAGLGLVAVGTALAGRSP